MKINSQKEDIPGTVLDKEHFRVKAGCSVVLSMPSCWLWVWATLADDIQGQLWNTNTNISSLPMPADFASPVEEWWVPPSHLPVPWSWSALLAAQAQDCYPLLTWTAPAPWGTWAGAVESAALVAELPFPQLAPLQPLAEKEQGLYQTETKWQDEDEN